MKVLMVEPGKSPYAAEIESGLKSLQAAVGGDIQAVSGYVLNLEQYETIGCSSHRCSASRCTASGRCSRPGCAACFTVHAADIEVDAAARHRIFADVAEKILDDTPQKLTVCHDPRPCGGYACR